MTLLCVFTSIMAQYPFSEEQIIAKLQFENPWWVTGSLDGFYESFTPRLYFNLFYPLVKNTTVHRASVLVGPSSTPQKHYQWLSSIFVFLKPLNHENHPSKIHIQVQGASGHRGHQGAREHDCFCFVASGCCRLLRQAQYYPFRPRASVHLCTPGEYLEGT